MAEHAGKLLHPELFLITMQIFSCTVKNIYFAYRIYSTKKLRKFQKTMEQTNTKKKTFFNFYLFV